MDVYYGREADMAALETVALEAGRAAHMARSACMGFATLGHPHVVSAEALLGQIEGQLRAIRAHLHDGKDAKPLLLTTGRGVAFVDGLFKEGCTPDDGFPAPRVEAIRRSVSVLRQGVVHMDQTINHAILAASSTALGTAPTAGVAAPERQEAASVRDAFLPSAFPCAEEQKWCTESGCRSGRHQAAISYGERLAAAAHATQDVVSWALLDPGVKDAANQITNVAGQIENDGRAMINVATQQFRAFNEGAMNNHAKNVDNHVATLRTLLAKPNPALWPNGVEEVQAHVDRVHDTLLVFRAAITA
eukprot:TRINITY_DN558_c0_g1_i2.p1 TRINITY_DN558_c0_g1~~TRINITY_DN558_c0_g1_i2.p1  ORF type:complete len:304 (+),score=92.69 TRINITY_DN558_c0_g1_i2:26-937(+)